MANTSKKSTEMDCLQNPSYFYCLPDEMLYKIFSNVPKNKFYLLAKVSQRFERICGDERFWKKVTVTQETISYFEFEQLITGPWDIRELDFTGVNKISWWRGRNPDLRVTLDKLTISSSGFPLRTGGTVTPEMILESASRCGILKACRTKELVMNRTTIDELVADGIAANGSHLQVLTMDYAKFHVRNLDMPSLETMIKNCCALRELSMRFGILNEPQLAILCAHLSTTVQKLFWNHVSFRIPRGWMMTDRRERITSNPLKMLFNRVKNLRELGLPLKYLVRPEAVDQMADLEFLETLHFCLCDFEHNELNLFSEALQKLNMLKRLRFSLKCPEYQMESAMRVRDLILKLKNWFKELSNTRTIKMASTDTEFVVEFVNNN